MAHPQSRARGRSANGARGADGRGHRHECARHSDDHPRRIYNPVQRDAATFLETSEETGGVRTLAELEVAPGGKVTPHYHLTYSERFKVLEGQTDRRDRRRSPRARTRRRAGRGGLGASTPGVIRARFAASSRSSFGPAVPALKTGFASPTGSRPTGSCARTACPATRSRRRWCSRWERYDCPVATPALERVLGLLARVARWRGVDRELFSAATSDHTKSHPLRCALRAPTPRPTSDPRPPTAPAPAGAGVHGGARQALALDESRFRPRHLDRFRLRVRATREARVVVATPLPQRTTRGSGSRSAWKATLMSRGRGAR